MGKKESEDRTSFQEWMTCNLGNLSTLTWGCDFLPFFQCDLNVVLCWIFHPFHLLLLCLEPNHRAVMESVGTVCESDKKSSCLLKFWHRHSHGRVGNLREGKMSLFVAACFLCFLFLSFILRLSLYTVKPNTSAVAPWAFENPKRGTAALSPSQWFPPWCPPLPLYLYECLCSCAWRAAPVQLKGSHWFAGWAFSWTSVLHRWRMAEMAFSTHSWLL